MIQEAPAYEHILNKLKAEKENGLKVITQEQVECYFVDYKEVVGDFSQKTSLNTYWGTLAKAISGFGNSLGGVLIFGVKDGDKSLAPFIGYNNFEVLVSEFISRSTNPKHESVRTHSFPSGDATRGYVVVEVPQSLNRPLQVISNDFNHRYFYRSGESHNDIPHDVLVGMLGYKLPPRLVCQFYVSEVDVSDKFVFEIILRNPGSTIARDIWFNADIGMPNVTVSQTNFSNQFEGAKVNNSCNLITKDTYKMAPQGQLSVLRFEIPKTAIKEEGEYHFYFTYGCEGSKINEFNSTFSGKDFNKISSGTTKDLIEFLKSKSPDNVVERL